jgi:RNA polymerase sigma factor (TIGR02999 family)
VSDNRLNDVLPEIYQDLKHLARMQRARFYSKKNLGTRSIVHEAYLNLIKNNTQYDNKDELLYLTAMAMRNIIVDNARAWSAEKRGGQLKDVSLEQVDLISASRSPELLALDAALKSLEKEHKRLADHVTCRFFGGLTQEETAQALDVSLATVKRDWALAKALLYEHLNHE